MQQTLVHDPHAERLVQIEVIDAEQLDVVFRGRQQAMLDLHALRRDAVSHREASNPIEQECDAKSQYDDRPLTRARNGLRPPHE